MPERSDVRKANDFHDANARARRARRLPATGMSSISPRSGMIRFPLSGLAGFLFTPSGDCAFRHARYARRR